MDEAVSYDWKSVQLLSHAACKHDGHYIRVKYLYPHKRLYMTENQYRILQDEIREKEGRTIEGKKEKQKRIKTRKSRT